jgi:WD40 repeat protein
LVCACAAAAAAAEGDDANQRPLPGGAVARFASTFLRHAGTVAAVAVSPDSKRVASAGNDGSVCVWDVATGARVFRLKTDANPRDIAFEPDGNTLACIHQGGRVTVLSLQGSPEPRTFPVKDSPFLHLSANGAVVVSVWNGGVAVSRVSDGNSLGEAESAGQPSGLIVAPRGDFFVTMCFNPRGGGFELKRWDVPSLHSPWAVTNRSGAAEMLQAVSPDGRLLAAAAYDGNIVLLDANTGGRLSAFPVEAGRVSCLEFLPGGGLMGIAPEGFLLWDANSGKRVAKFDTTTNAVAALKASPDGSFVATAGPWHMVGLWNARTGQSLFDLHGHFGPITGVAFAQGGGEIVSASADGAVRRWGAAGGNDTLLATLRDARSQWMAVAPGGKWALSRSYNQRPSVTLWDLDSGRPSRSLDPGESSLSAAFSPDAQFLATGGYQYIRVWHVASGRLLRQIESRSDAGMMNAALAFSADDKMLAAGGAANGPGPVRLFEAATGLEAARLDLPGGQVRSLAFSPDGRSLLATTRHALVCDLCTLTPSGTLSGRAIPAAVPSGKEDDKQVDDDGGIASAVAFSADGRKVATGGDDGAILLWNAPRAAPIPATQPADGNEMAGLWEALASDDANRAFAAAQRLTREGPAAVAFLKDQLKPLAPATGPVDIGKLLANLDGDNYRVREEASRKLAEVGDTPRLQAALDGAKSDEVRTRLTDLLANLANPTLTDRAELRRSRAIRVLEIIGDSAAREVLSRLAEGGPGRLTRDAGAALARLKAAAP